MDTEHSKPESAGKTKLSGHEQVTGFMNKLDHPLKREIAEIREVILNANGQITEHIKWNAPSFRFNDEDRITFNLRGKGYFMLVFHRGAKVKEVPGETPPIEDSTGLLEWAAPDRAIVKFANGNDVLAKKEMLAEVIKKWIAL